MFAKMSDVFTQILTWIGEFVTALTSADGSLSGLQEMFLLGIGISVVMVAVKLVRKITWGA